MKCTLIVLACCFILPHNLAADITPTSPTNKLLMMHRLYYLPFSMGFQQGGNLNEIIPIISKTGTVPTADEFGRLNRVWGEAREEWAKSSLLLNTPIDINGSSRISGHLASHLIALGRGPFERLSVTERIQIKNLLKGKPEMVQKTFTQIRFLKSFLTESDADRTVLFIVGASWCQSSRTYRALLESYLKRFPVSDLTLHSIVVDDPKNQIFDSAILGQFFPSSASYSHNTIPRFLLLENTAEPVLYEEGDALSVVLDRYFSSQRGFLDSLVPFLNQPVRGLSGGWTNK